MTYIAYRPEIKFTHRMEWDTDVHRAYDGSEKRIAKETIPRESYDFTYNLTDAQVRLLREKIINDPDALYEIPFFCEEAVIPADVNGTSVQVDRTYLDWIAVGQVVLVTNQAGQSYRSSISVAPAGPGVVTLTLADTKPVSQTYSKGISHICPIYGCYLEDQGQVSRYAVNITKWRVKAIRNTFDTTFGTGASLTTLSSMNVLDRAPGANQQVGEMVEGGLELLDTGAKIAAFSAFNQGNIVRQCYFTVNGRAVKQYFKKFFDSVKAKQKAFLAPSFCYDFIPHAATATVSGGATSFKLDGPPTTDANDYVTNWWPHTSFRWVQITYTNGTIDRRAVTNAVDNMDGTQTLTVAALTGGTIDKVSLMPKSRFATDRMEFDHDDAHTSKLRVDTVTIQQ